MHAGIRGKQGDWVGGGHPTAPCGQEDKAPSRLCFSIPDTPSHSAPCDGSDTVWQTYPSSLRLTRRLAGSVNSVASWEGQACTGKQSHPRFSRGISNGFLPVPTVLFITYGCFQEEIGLGSTHHFILRGWSKHQKAEAWLRPWMQWNLILTLPQQAPRVSPALWSAAPWESGA